MKDKEKIYVGTYINKKLGGVEIRGGWRFKSEYDKNWSNLMQIIIQKTEAKAK